LRPTPRHGPFGALTKQNAREGIFKAQLYGKSTLMRERMVGVATELYRSGTVEGPAPQKLETRKSLVSAWIKAAEVLDAQGEVILAGEVHYFARHLPPVLTDRQRFAAQFIRFKEQQRRAKPEGPVHGNPKVQERTL
jgi:hypothetical protein